MRTQLYNLLRRTASQETRNRHKRGVLRARVRLAPLYRARYGTFGATELRDELFRRLPPDVEILMVHCSLNDLQPMYVGGGRDLLDALIELCGPERTLAMPAFFFGGPVGDSVAYYRRQPSFDVRRCPSEMGLLSELFRRRRDVRRSLHPTHSRVCARAARRRARRGHHLASTTFGEGTPFAFLAARRTVIAGIGIEYFRCLTQVHTAEDLLGEHYPLALRSAKLAIKVRDASSTLQDYELPIDETNLTRRLERLEHLLGPDELVRWRFHGVPLFVTTAARVTDALMAAALRGETIYDAMPIRVTATPTAAR